MCSSDLHRLEVLEREPVQPLHDEHPSGDQLRVGSGDDPATLAELGSVSRLRGIAHLRGHETDRLAALTAEINGLGGRCEETPDGLEIIAAGMHGGVWRAYADHRMAMAGAIIGLRVPEVEVDDIGSTSKTLPQFPELWKAMLGK